MESPRRHTVSWPAIGLLAFFGLSLAVRVFGAWCYRFATNLDHATVALMVKHMAEGSGFPMFFYGQAYMGSLEPLFSALLCRIFGFSGFMIDMGPALIGLAISIAVYGWASRISGRTAGLAAALFLMIGPKGYFHYLASPRGGYAIQMLLTVLMLWSTCSILRRLNNRGAYPSRLVFLLGVMAGLGWWSSGLILFTVMTCLLMLFFGSRRIWNFKTAWGVAGTVIGSAPWWIWNLFNDFESLRMTNSLTNTGLTTGLALFFGNRMLRILQIFRLPDVWYWIGLAIVLAAVAYAVLSLVRKKMPGLNPGYRADVASCLIMFPVSALIYSLTEFAAFDTARYHLPLIPVFAVLIGLLTAYLVARFRWAGWLPVLILMGVQSANLPDALAWERKDRALVDKARPLIERMIDKGPAIAYASTRDRWMNISSLEQALFVPLYGAGYTKHSKRADQADEIGVISNYRNVIAFLNYAGGQSAYSGFEGVTLHDAFEPPEALVPAFGAIQSITTKRDQRDLTEVLTDDHADTGLDENPDRDFVTLEITTDPSQDVQGFRLIFRQAMTPALWQLTAGAGDVFGLTPIAPYHWSGERIYGEGTDYALSARLPPGTKGPFTVRLKNHRHRNGWKLQEVRALTGAAITELDIAELADALTRHGVRRVYANRWLGHQLNRAAGDEAFEVFRQAYYSKTDQARIDARLDLSEKTALVLESRRAVHEMKLLHEQGFRVDSHVIGGWTLLFPEFSASLIAPAEWRGDGVLKCDDKIAAVMFQQLGIDALAGGDAEPAAEMLRRSVDLYENDPVSWSALSDALTELGQADEAARLRARADSMWKPDVAAAKPLHADANFVGFQLDHQDVDAGSEITLNYLWTFDPQFHPNAHAAFVHFLQDGKIIFQDDHNLNIREDTRLQPSGHEVFAMRRTIRIPDDAPAGEYDLRLGLIDASGKRLRSSLFSSGAVTVDTVLTVR